ncbi:Serine/threonine protein kinase [Rhodococcus maanshanensis]|uniref:Serine/threonine protein kinase n=2 Tax=Rhodococcus maanshanensis TaxID=183556 RepID=A0A1H7HBM3_9NOCA|nr:Serine/threonine protein kinase [Rhodococcus maanshanensis]
MDRTGRSMPEGTIVGDPTRRGHVRTLSPERMDDERAVRTGSIDDINVGQRIDDFDLLMGLGRGAFARVFLARQRSMHRLVAVKISQDHGTEPQTMAQLDHDYIVRVFDQRYLEQFGVKLLYMQYVPGGTLLAVLRRIRGSPQKQRGGQVLLDAIDEELAARGEIRPTDSSVRAELATLSWPETVAWVGRRLALALDHASRQGVIHRDIKPANILLTAEGVPKLTDFNISFSAQLGGVSPAAYFGGSLAYMSPEQLAARHPHATGSAADLDTRSDIFALGVLLWELLTGRRPFRDAIDADESDTSLSTMLDLRSRRIDPDVVAALPPNCPATLRRVLLTCLAPDPRDRWQSGADLAQQFELCLDPQARDLVDPPPGSWRLRLRPWSAPIIFIGLVFPNLLAGLYNYVHNRTLIVSKLSPAAVQQFGLFQLLITAIVFPAMVVLLAYMWRRPIAVTRALSHGRTFDPTTLAKARADTLLLGSRMVVVCFGAWWVSTVVNLFAMQVATGVPRGSYVHFLASTVVCGAIVMAYPFFLVTFYMVRCLYPVMLPPGIISGDDTRRLRGLERLSNRYLALAASVPLLGVAGATFLPAADLGAIVVPIRVLCLGAIVAFVAAYWMFRQLEQDLHALERVVSGEPGPAFTLGGPARAALS